MKSINIEIPGHPEPAPRVTKRSLWRGKKYAAWKAGAAALIKSKARGRKLETPCVLTLWIHKKDRRGDIDNFCKAVMDALVLSGIIPGDTLKHVPSLRVYSDKTENEKVLIELRSVDEDGYARP